MIFNTDGTSVLLQEYRGRYFLPEIRVQQFTRPAEQITSLLRLTWGMTTVLLFSGLFKSEAPFVYYAVLEQTQEPREIPPGMVWYPVAAAISDLSEEKAGECLKSAHAKATALVPGNDPQPFARLGWIAKLQDWIKKVPGPRCMELGGFRQLNGCETFALVRFDTSEEPVWFKAVGAPNLHEFPITLALSAYFPNNLPRIIASNKSLNGWLMDSGGRSRLRDRAELDSWIKAVHGLATLQAQSIDKTQSLLRAGCRDLRIELLASLVDPFFEVIAALMKKQTKIRPSPLTEEELFAISFGVKEALQSLQEIGIPNALGHSDFNPGNIVTDGNDCVFLDWAEAHVGQPVLTLEYLMAHLRKDFPTLVEQESVLRQEYIQSWPASISHAIGDALALAPLVALYAYAVSGERWRDPERLAAPQFCGYLRSLTRQMKKHTDFLCGRTVHV